MSEAILNVCRGHYVSIASLGELLKRNPSAIRQQYLKSLVDEGKLRLAFPEFKTDPKQGYSTVENGTLDQTQQNESN
ncbi:hypothetical protein [Dongshaea marina]|uniref:hypothetical protein n=1 Tax=Dongshaea marina TaxID=2047966 RepID=UPI001F321D3B|nr:hypothetical protein [Dongshaea marina]